jgi:hypothetical protein
LLTLKYEMGYNTAQRLSEQRIGDLMNL